MRAVIAIVVCVLFLGCAAESIDDGESGIAEGNGSVGAEGKNESGPEEPPQAGDSEDLPAPALENASENPSSTDDVGTAEPGFDFNITTENGSLKVYFFHSPGCSACKASYPLITDLKERYPHVVFVNHSLSTSEGTRAYVRFAELYNLSTQQRLVPQVLVNRTIITDRFNIEERLEPILSEFSD